MNSGCVLDFWVTLFAMDTHRFKNLSRREKVMGLHQKTFLIVKCSKG